ncbi:N-acetylmuramoyl-L-alanine amidase [Salmonella enterica]
MSSTIKLIVIHCAASPNGKQLGTATETAAQVIDRWHSERGFHRLPQAVRVYNPQLPHIGYHWVIDTDGTTLTGRRDDEIGAHVKGYNTDSIGICLVGTDKFTPDQWRALNDLVGTLLFHHPNARICGHRDLSPDLNGDGKITPNEYMKLCPGFQVLPWLASGRAIPEQHVYASTN